MINYADNIWLHVYSANTYYNNFIKYILLNNLDNTIRSYIPDKYLKKSWRPELPELQLLSSPILSYLYNYWDTEYELCGLRQYSVAERNYNLLLCEMNRRGLFNILSEEEINFEN